MSGDIYGIGPVGAAVGMTQSFARKEELLREWARALKPGDVVGIGQGGNLSDVVITKITDEELAGVGRCRVAYIGRRKLITAVEGTPQSSPFNHSTSKPMHQRDKLHPTVSQTLEMNRAAGIPGYGSREDNNA